jgi:hypothetical protein
MIWLVLNLMLAGMDPVRGTEFEQILMKNQAIVEHAKTDAVLRRNAQFHQRFNDLVDAVAGFAAEYNQNHGQVWPAKKAEALRRAMRALESVDSRLKK